MDSDWNACDILEGLSAEIIATSPGDPEAMSDIATRLSKTVELMDEGSAAGGLVQLVVQIVDAVAEGTLVHPESGMVVVTEATSAVVRDMKNEDERSGERFESISVAAREVLASRTESQSPIEILDASPLPESLPETEGGTSEMEDQDTELLEEFVTEVLEHLATAESALLQLESDPHDVDHVNTILRAFHTVKGASAFLGLDKIQHLAHLAESLLTQVRDGEILLTGNHADVALKSCDALKKMTESIGTDAPLPEGHAELVAVLGGESAPKVAPQSADNVMPLASTSSDRAVSPELVEESDPGHSSGDSAIRVSTRRLDDLIDMVGELVIAQSIVVQGAESTDSTDSETASLAHSVSHAGKIVRELQDLAMSLRMVPLKGTFAKMNRVARDLAKKSGKNVQLITRGEDTEIDRNMVETLTAPLIHMIRNAVDHGIESTEARARQGKAATGVLSLKAYHSAGNVIIDLSDDGKGLDRDKILNKAIAVGLAQKDADLTDRDVFNLIFEPGFSTADEVTEVSGRGVGMDVVKRNLTSLHGRIEVSSELGQGTRFRLSLPLTMAITDAMVVKVGTESYLLPTIAIERSFRPEAGAVSNFAGDGEVVMYRDEVLPIVRLHEVFEISDAATDPTQGLMVVVYGNGRRCALMVDSLVGHQQAVIKSLGQALRDVQGTAGAAILGDGRVGLILDPDSLVNLALGRGHGNDLAPAA
jgi:two-component system, chemotaxis family, sensor kinase CheA